MSACEASFDTPNVVYGSAAKAHSCLARRQSRAIAASWFCCPRWILLRARRRLGYDHTRGPQQTVVKRVTIFENLNHAARDLFRRIRFQDCFVLPGIERRVERIDFSNPEAIQDLSQNA